MNDPLTLCPFYQPPTVERSYVRTDEGYDPGCKELRSVAPDESVGGRRTRPRQRPTITGPVSAAAFTLILIATFARAEPVYRCGNAYQDTPCPGATIVDAEPNKGMEVRTSSGAVVRSPNGDKGRTARAMELGRENIHNGIVCGLATETATVTNSRSDCPTAKAQQDAKRLTPDYIRK